jgi:hypothetical protein
METLKVSRKYTTKMHGCADLLVMCCFDPCATCGASLVNVRMCCVEGVRLDIVIGSQKTSSVYDNILCHIQFYTPESLETEQKAEFLSHMLITNPSIKCVTDEIKELWRACPDPPGATDIQSLRNIPDIPDFSG